MKKTISIGMISAMLSYLLILPSYAAGTAVGAGNASCAAGGTVSIPITVSGNTGFANLGIEIGYDSSVLTLRSAAAAQTGAIYTPAQNITANPYNMILDSTTNNSYNGTLATLEFEVAGNAAAGNYPITVSFFSGRDGGYEDGLDVNYDENFTPLSISYTNGYITVESAAPSGKSISVGNVQGNVRSGGDISFKASFRSDEGITGVAIAAVYDNAGKLIAAKNFDATSEVDFSFINVSDAAMVKVFWWESINDVIPQTESKTIMLQN